jgi:hypothetical protein
VALGANVSVLEPVTAPFPNNVPEGLSVRLEVPDIRSTSPVALGVKVSDAEPVIWP